MYEYVREQNFSISWSKIIAYAPKPCQKFNDLYVQDLGRSILRIILALPQEADTRASLETVLGEICLYSRQPSERSHTPDCGKFVENYRSEMSLVSG